MSAGQRGSKIAIPAKVVNPSAYKPLYKVFCLEIVYFVRPVESLRDVGYWIFETFYPNKIPPLMGRYCLWDSCGYKYFTPTGFCFLCFFAAKNISLLTGLTNPSFRMVGAWAATASLNFSPTGAGVKPGMCMPRIVFFAQYYVY